MGFPETFQPDPNARGTNGNAGRAKATRRGGLDGDAMGEASRDVPRETNHNAFICILAAKKTIVHPRRAV